MHGDSPGPWKGLENVGGSFLRRKPTSVTSTPNWHALKQPTRKRQVEQSQLLAQDVLTKEWILRNDSFYPLILIQYISILMKNLTNLNNPELIFIYQFGSPIGVYFILS